MTTEMKVVLDTNVLISSLIKTGKPRVLLYRLVKDKQLILSKAIIEEFLEITEDPKAVRYVSEQDVTLFLNALKRSEIVQVISHFKVITEDPDDDIIIRTAYDSKTDYIVSGDKHLLALKDFKGIRILTVDEMLNVLNNEHLARE